MKLGILFSGGKDSTYAVYTAKKEGYEVSCLISVFSENEESFMFHTPSINCVERQAEVMGIPLVKIKTQGEKERELEDLEKVISIAIERFGIEGVVSGAVESVYQSSRIQQICDKLSIECFNPLWLRNSEEYWDELLKSGFEIILTGVFAEGLGREWLGKKINHKNLGDLKKICKKYNIHLSFEGGEAETLVLNCPLFARELRVLNFFEKGEHNSWRMEVFV